MSTDNPGYLGTLVHELRLRWAWYRYSRYMRRRQKRAWR